MFPITLESSITIIIFRNLKFRKNVGTYSSIMGLRSGPLRADVMSAYSWGKFIFLSKFQLHAARSTLCRLSSTSRVDSQRQLQPTGPKASGSSKGRWKRHTKHSEGGRPQHFDKPNRPFVGAYGSVGHAYMDMLIPHYGRRGNCLLMSKRKRILGLRLSRNCLKQHFSKGLKPALTLIAVSRVISLRHVQSQSRPNY